MKENYNNIQIIRKDAKGCFVESLCDYFPAGKAHLQFVAYNVNMPEGQRQTALVNLYIGVDELQEICRKISSGELRYMLTQLKQTGNFNQPLMEWLGGTSAGKLAAMGKSRKDGKSVSRTAKLLPGKKSDFFCGRQRTGRAERQRADRAEVRKESGEPHFGEHDLGFLKRAFSAHEGKL